MSSSFKNQTFFNHFLCLTIKHYRESSHIFAQCPFLTSRSTCGNIWPSGGLMRTKGENIDKTAFTFSAREKKRIQYFRKFFFENEFLKDMFSRVFLRFPLLFYVFLCFPLILPVFPCFSMFSYDSPSFSAFFYAFPCLPVFSYVSPCFPMFSYVFS